MWDIKQRDARLWLAAQISPAARGVERLLSKQAAEIVRLETRIELLDSGVPSGVTAEEWEILHELRKALGKA